jgi:heterodisulfide reductase subunit D
MPTVAVESTQHKLLEKLVKTFGPEKILTDYEDLYVYSFHGEFGTRRHQLPLAILRLRSDSDERELNRILEASGVHIIKNNEHEDEKEFEKLGIPVMLIDSREPVNTVTLQERLSELTEAKAKGKQRLRDASSFPHWFVSSLKNKDGYRLNERPNCDNGYCPIQKFFDGVETYSSKGRLLLTRGLLRGELTATEKLVDSIYTCTACGQCYDQLALMGLEVNNAIIRTRHEIVKRGVHPKQCGTLTRNVLEEGNPMGMPAEDRTFWFEEIAGDFPFKGNDVLYWAGCSTGYRLPGIVESTVNVLRKADVDFGLLGENEGCCGLILYLLGLWDESRENALETSGKLRDLGVKLLVTSCAGCYYAFTKVYPLLNVYMPLKVLHTSQLIESLILDGRLRLRGMKGDFMWHDPCDLGRHCKVFEPPRNVLKAIPRLELKEPPLNREHAICCGAGGGLWMYNADLAEKIAHSKLEEDISPLDIDGVVTGCPTCILNLKYAAKSLNHELNVYDLAEIVNQCI